jgi:hypothetical protein
LVDYGNHRISEAAVQLGPALEADTRRLGAVPPRWTTPGGIIARADQYRPEVTAAPMDLPARELAIPGRHRPDLVALELAEELGSIDADRKPGVAQLLDE